VFFDYKVLMIV